MTMNFRTIKTNIQNILGAAAALSGKYRVIGYQPQGQASSQVLNDNRLVQVFFQEFSIPKSHAGITGPFQSDTTYVIELTVSAANTGDLATLNDSGSDNAQRAAALADFLVASKNADDQFDELVDMVVQTLLNGENLDIGTVKPYPVSDRWIPGAKKDQPKQDGGLVVLTGRIMFNCLINEDVPGATPTPAGALPFDQTTDLVGDDNEQTGVST